MESGDEMVRVKQEPDAEDEAPSKPEAQNIVLLPTYLKVEVEVEAAPVKEEPREGGHPADHEVRDEQVLGPETVQQPKTLRDWLPSGRGARLARDCGVRPEQRDAETARAEHETEHRMNTDARHAAETSSYVCDTCGKTYQEKNCLIRHFKVHLRKKYTKAVHTEGKTYTCEICKKHFTHPSTLSVHKRLHTGVKPYSCKICKKAFNQTGVLQRHERTHTGIKLYSCEKCSMKFTEARGLRMHKQLHAGEKPFSCEICKKKFAQSHHLKTHKLMHSGEKPFACSVCKKDFTQLSNLKTHMVVHTGEKPFPCEICKKGFTQRSHLKRHHTRIHTGERPYKCEICQRSFKETGALKTHRRIHIG